MFRALILMVFTYFFYQLHSSGDLSKYINMKYAYISYIAIFILAILTLVQIYNVSKNQEEVHCCDHDHEHEKNKPFYKRMMIYIVFIFPLVTGLFFPIATLDSTIVKSKGFSFQVLEENEQADPYAQTQFLNPDTSIYYGEEGYYELLQKGLEEISSTENVILTEENYLKGMEIIYNFPGQFEDKTIEFDGFTFNGESINEQQLFVLRFGIIHCIADSGAYGMLVEFPEDIELEDDQWIHMKGTLSTTYYQPFKATIPYLIVEEYNTIPEPEDPYTYRTY